MKLILLPGMDGTGRLFADFVKSLPSAVDPVIVSYPQNEKLSYDRLEGLVAERLPLGGDYVILAESFSGPIAISLAAKSPSRLKGLILCCTFARNPQPLFTLFGRLIPVSIVPERLRHSMLLGLRRRPSIESALEEILKRIPDNVLKYRINEVHTHNVEALLSRIGVPVIYLRATNDRLISCNTADDLVSKMKAGSVIDIEGPHMLLQVNPVAASKVVSGFIHKLLQEDN